MKVNKANPGNPLHIQMYNTFCLNNNISPNIAYSLEKARKGELEENRYSKTLYFFTEKDQMITESCTVSILKDLKKATLALSTKQPPKASKLQQRNRNENVLTLVTDCLDYLFTVEPVEDILIQMKDIEIGKPLQAYGYDVLSLGTDEKGNMIYSVEKELEKEERKQII